MYRKTKFLMASLVMLFGLGFVIQRGASAPTSLTVPWLTFDGGGGRSSKGNLEVTGTIGQPDAGPMSGGSFSLSGGFWVRPFALVPAPDLMLTKSVTPAVAERGDTVTFTLSYGNVGNATAADVVISDEMPAEIVDLTFQSDTSGLTLMAGPGYQWQLAELAPDASGTITITGTVDTHMIRPGTLVNRASITAAGDSNPNNNDDEVSLSVIIDEYILIVPAAFGDYTN